MDLPGVFFFFFFFFFGKNNSLYKLSSVFQNVPEVSMDLIVQIFVIHATLHCVNDLKAIAHMDRQV
jgi:succinate dehydrogenase hydrophobic anchor subunit